MHDRLNQLGCPNLVGVDFGAGGPRDWAEERCFYEALMKLKRWDV